MRSWFCVQLGTWHCYKQATSVVWGHWGARVFAPLYHELIDGAYFYRKARLATVARFLTYVRLAYPSFRKTLKAARSRAEEEDMDNVAKSHFRDLTKLLEYFIPVVSCIIQLIIVHVCDTGQQCLVALVFVHVQSCHVITCVDCRLLSLSCLSAWSERRCSH